MKLHRHWANLYMLNEVFCRGSMSYSRHESAQKQLTSLSLLTWRFTFLKLVSAVNVILQSTLLFCTNGSVGVLMFFPLLFYHLLRLVFSSCLAWPGPQQEDPPHMGLVLLQVSPCWGLFPGLGWLNEISRVRPKKTSAHLKYYFATSIFFSCILNVAVIQL